MNENWRPSASIQTLKARARILQDIRAFFAARDVTEVQVPSITLSGITDVNIDSIPVSLIGRTAYLHTSPEYPMKRLLAAGLQDCYYLGSVFRQGEHGLRHNPEFTMLEWYRMDEDMHTLAHEVIEFMRLLLPSDKLSVKFVSYAGALRDVTGLDVFNCNIDDVKTFLTEQAIDSPCLDSIDEYFDLLMSLVVIPKLGKVCNTNSSSVDFSIVCLHSYPLSQAALAEELKDEYGRSVAGRFEIIVNGLEIANGYQECRDAEVLQQRFEQDNLLRKRLKKVEMPLDTKFLAAHAEGLPRCSGVALGVDRLCMLILGKTSIDEVIAFPIDRC